MATLVAKKRKIRIIVFKLLQRWIKLKAPDRFIPKLREDAGTPIPRHSRMLLAGV